MNVIDRKAVGKQVLRVLLATPFGAQGRGGIDRLVDLIVNGLDRNEELATRAVRLVTRGEGGLPKGSFVFAAALARLWRAARENQADLLHINLASSGSTYRKLILAALAHRLGMPYVVHLHSGRFDRFWADSRPEIARAINGLFANSNAIIVLGESWKKIVCDRVPQARDKINVLANATLPSGCERAPASDGRARITFLGKIGPNKGTRELLQALATMSDRSDWVATICGNGAVEEARMFANTLGIGDRTRFPGWLGVQETAAQLRETDIFVLPSFSEGLPMSILEAFAWGIPVVATPVGSIPEVVEHNSNGLIVPAGDVEALAQGIQRLVQDPELREALGKAARQDHAVRFNIQNYVPRLATIWRKAVSSSASATVRPKLAETR